MFFSCVKPKTKKPAITKQLSRRVINPNSDWNPVYNSNPVNAPANCIVESQEDYSHSNEKFASPNSINDRNKKPSKNDTDTLPTIISRTN